MRDIRSGSAGRAVAGPKRIAEWNTRNDTLRQRRLGIQHGVPFNRTQATARLPFQLPRGYRVEEDGSIAKALASGPRRRPR